MTVVFWTAVVAMLAISLWLIVPPLLGHHRARGADRRALTVAIYRERLAELERQRAEGTLEPGAYAQAQRETERALLAELPAEEPQHPQAPARPAGARAAAVVVGLAVPALALGLYLTWGSHGSLSLPQGMPPTQAQGGGAGEHPSLEQFIARLEARSQAEPGNAENWLMLGRAYAMEGRLEQARLAFGEAHALAPDDPEAMVGLAQVLGRLQGNDLSGRPAALLDRALERAPNAPNALWLGGIAAFQGGDMTVALERWQRLRRQGNLSDDETRMLDDFIARAREGMGADAPATAEAAPAGAGGASLRVQVSLAPELADRVQPTDPLFIYARAVDGPPMPLAIVRASAGDLPMTVVLDDSKSMLPDLKLSGFDSVVVGARIAKNGTATATSGDLQGLSDAVAVADGTPVAISIADVVP